MPATVQFFLPARNILILCLAAALLCACGSNKQLSINPDGNIHDAIEAATGPLEDLNIRRTEIPPLLKTAMSDPYAHKAKIRCPDLKSEVAQLDELLGPDVEPTGITLASADGNLVETIGNVGDVELPDRASMVDSAADLAHDTVMSAIRSHTSIIPFRSIVRKLTGADRHQRMVEDAYQAGKLRRAYLKGLAEQRFGRKCLAKPVVVEAKAEPPPVAGN